MAGKTGAASEVKTGPAFFKTDIDGDAHLVTQIFSVTGVIDSYADRIHAGAFKKTLKERFDRIQVLWQHNLFDPPIGTLLEAFEIGADELPKELRKQYPEATGALQGKVEYLDTPRGNEVLMGIRKRALKENSIGLDAVKVEFTEEQQGKLTMKLREIMEVRLWDVSPVNWGANPATMNIKGAIPFKSTGVDRKTTWAKPALSDFGVASWEDASEEEKQRVAAHFAWVASEVFSDYKFPHHNPSKNTVGPANWNGIKAAMGRLMQATVQIDSLDSVYSHLAKHYKDDFDEEPPDLKLIDLAYSVRAAMSLGRENLYECFEAMEALNAALKRAEPQVLGLIPSQSALTLEMGKEQIRMLRHRAGI